MNIKFYTASILIWVLPKIEYRVMSYRLKFNYVELYGLLCHPQNTIWKKLPVHWNCSPYAQVFWIHSIPVYHLAYIVTNVFANAATSADVTRKAEYVFPTGASCFSGVRVRPLFCYFVLFFGLVIRYSLLCVSILLV